MAAGFLDLGTTQLSLDGRTHVMGVINLSPDSKNLHTVARSVDEALLMADRYRSWGATLIDVGGQSSHYENPTIPEADEISRVIPVIEALCAEDHLVAVDTWKPGVAEEAVGAGAVMLNDTGGLRDPEMRQLVAESGVAAIAVRVEAPNPHEVGEIKPSPAKTDEMTEEFRSLLDELEADGIRNVIVDPGIAINYRGDYEEYTRLQLEVISRSSRLHELGKPVLIPIPRKKDFHRVVAYIALALEHEADIIRVHDVAVACDLARLFRRLD